MQEFSNKMAASETEITSPPNFLKLDRETVQALFAPGMQVHFRELRYVQVDRGTPVRPFGRRQDFADHLEMLAQEFSGQPVLHFVHAGLNAHIRREIELQENLARFWAMWQSE